MAVDILLQFVAIVLVSALIVWMLPIKSRAAKMALTALLTLAAMLFLGMLKIDISVDGSSASLTTIAARDQPPRVPRRSGRHDPSVPLRGPLVLRMLRTCLTAFVERDRSRPAVSAAAIS